MMYGIGSRVLIQGLDQGNVPVGNPQKELDIGEQVAEISLCITR
jgi:hypothetical protein